MANQTYRDNNHPFFKPLWRRVLIVALCLVWSAVEWWNGQTLWGVLTLAAAIYAIITLFIRYEVPDEG